MKIFMKKFALGAAGLALAAFGLMTAVGTSAQNSRQSAGGHGTVLVQDPEGDTARRQFSFSAHQRPDGTVSGNAVLHNPAFTGENGQRYRLQVDISCMKIIGNIAFFGGLTRRTNDPNLVDAVYFSVQDNGEPGRDLDQISGVFFFDDDPTTTGDPQLCQNNVVGDFPMQPIEAGNIQVRP
jgi:hypothetical protein